MDSFKPKSAKQLKEHLQNHQEPFSLQNHLIERSYMFRSRSSNSCNIHSLYSGKNLKWPIKYDLHKIRKRFLHATAFLRSLLYKFIPSVDNHDFSFSSWDEEHNNNEYHVHDDIIAHTTLPAQQTRLAVNDHFVKNCVEENHSSTLVDMFDTFTLPKLRRSEVDADTEPYWISSSEKRRWKEPFPNAACHSTSQKLVRDPVFSTYLRKLLVNSNILKFRHSKKDKLEGIVETASLCQRNRKILRKRKQLPFVCVEKDREFRNNEGKSLLPIKAVSQSEELQSILHEHFSLLEKQYIQVKKINQVLNLNTESSVKSEEWKSFQFVNWEIQMEIGDSIMDDIVTETIDLFWEA